MDINNSYNNTSYRIYLHYLLVNSSNPLTMNVAKFINMKYSWWDKNYVYVEDWDSGWGKGPYIVKKNNNKITIDEDIKPSYK